MMNSTEKQVLHVDFETLAGKLQDVVDLANELANNAHSNTAFNMFKACRTFLKTHEEYVQFANYLELESKLPINHLDFQKEIRSKMVNVCRDQVLAITPDEFNREVLNVNLLYNGVITCSRDYLKSKYVMINDVVKFHKYKKTILFVDFSYRPKKFNYEA